MKQELSWEDMYRLAVKYYTSHGRLVVPDAYKIRGISLNQWLNSQRQDYKDGRLTQDKIAKLNNLGIKWGIVKRRVKKYTWEEMYEKLAQWIKENNTPNIPTDYVTDDYANLGDWVVRQRQKYIKGRLGSTEYKRLDALGIRWTVDTPKRIAWSDYYKLAEEYYELHGNIDIPVSYNTNGLNLGYWIHRQKQRNRSKIISVDEYVSLDKLGMKWDISKSSGNDLTWEGWYELLLSYNHAFGDIDVPERYVTPNGYLLGSWLNHQRQAERRHKITREHKEKLDALNMDWVPPHRVSFAEKELSYYIDKYSSAKIIEDYNHPLFNTAHRLDIYIPDKGLAFEYDGRTWHYAEKDLKKNSLCKENGIQLIRIREKGNEILPYGDGCIYYNLSDTYSLEDAIKDILKVYFCKDVVIDLKSDYQEISKKVSDSNEWNTMYRIAKKYYLEHGDLNVKDSKYNSKEMKKLAIWLSNKKTLRNMGKLPDVKIQKLDDIGMIWSMSEKQWDEHYQIAKRYYKEHGNLLIKETEQIDDLKMGYWIVSQRGQYKAGKLSEDRIDKLNAIGMCWDVLKEGSDKIYNLCEEYHKTHGNLLIPQHYSVDGANLGHLVSALRLKKKKNKMTAEEINKYERLGMVWDMREYEWERKYNLCMSYYEEHGDLNITKPYIVDGINLYFFISTERRRRREGKVTPEQIEKLEAIGFEWKM